MTETIALPALMTLPGVELVAAGTWDLSTGEATFTADDLASAVEAAQCPAVGDPVIKLGHVDPRFDGEPAVGHVANMAVAAEGTKLTGDLAGMPGWLGAVMASAYPQRSIEGAWDFRCQIGHVHPFVITALALLGTSAPGVGVLGSLDDVAALYGLAQAAKGEPRQSWHLNISGGNMPGKAFAAGVTTEDVRRAYYDASGTPYSFWITEMQLVPPQLIVSDDATAKVYRVPISIDGGEITFGEAVEVEVEYVDIKAGSGVVTFASKALSRRGYQVAAAWSASTQLKNMGDDPTATAIKAMFALPADTKSDSKLPHHMCSADGVVGAANDDGCSAGIAAINGAHGGLKGVSDADLKSAYNHLAKHITDDGGTPPEFNAKAARAAAGDDDADDDPKQLIAGLDATLDEAVALIKGVDLTALPEEVAQALDLLVAAEGTVDTVMDLLSIYDPDDAAAGGAHGSFNGVHAHAHSAFGSQGGDATHDHSHSHAGDNRHNHAHAAKGTTRKGGSGVDFTKEQQAQLRTALGMAEDDELTPELVAAGMARLSQDAASAAAQASRKMPPGVIAVEKDAWDEQVARAKQGEEALARIRRNERDQVIMAAVGAGKIAPANRPKWERMWDKDPDGTREVIAGLAKNAFPTQDIGLPGGPPDEEMDEEYRRLFPDGAYKTEAAQG